MDRPHNDSKSMIDLLQKGSVFLLGNTLNNRRRLLGSPTAHVKRTRCGGRGRFSVVGGIIASHCDCTDPPQLPRRTGDD